MADSLQQSVAGILYNDGKVFVAQRLPQGAMGGRWEFPGGKVENSETLQEALIREFDEEFSTKISVGECLAKTYFTHHTMRALFAYRVFTQENPLAWQLHEHTEVRWISLRDITNLSFVDSDMLLLPEILAWETGRGGKTE